MKKQIALLENLRESFTISGNQIVCGFLASDGSIANRTEIAEVNNSYYQFHAFHVWKIYLDLAANFEEKAEKLIKEIQINKQTGRTLDKKKIYTLTADDPNTILQYFMSLIAAYIFSFTEL